MAHLVNTTVRIEGVLRRWEHRVELRLLHIGSVSVDSFQRGGSVEREAVGAESHDGAVGLVTAPEFEVAVTFPGMVDRVPVRNFG